MSKKYTTNFLEDTNGSTGSANQVLVSTAAGIDWVDGSGSGIIGGPYLPLAGGTLTGNTNLTGSTKKLILNSGAQLGFEDANPTGTIYLYNDGAATSRLNIGGTMWVEEAGNVGIGTTSPTQKLHVDGNTLISAEKYYYTAGTGAGFGSDASGNFKIRQNGADLIFGSGNNVGIGTTSPSEKLHVAGGGSGNIRLDAGGTYYGTNIQAISSAGLKIGNDDFSGYAFFNDAGNVGIGTTSPGAKLNILSTGIDDEALVIQDNARKIKIGRDSIKVTDLSNAVANMYLQGDGGNVILSNAASRLGIGTTSPGANLDVAGAAPVIRITNTTDPLGNGTVGSFEFFTKDSSTGATRTVSSIVCDNNAGSSVPEGELVFKTSLGGGGSPVATEKMRIDSSGNVGIGTASPDSKLHVELNSSGATPISQQQLILENNTATGIAILTPSTTSGYLFFGDNNDAQRGYIVYSHPTDEMKFKVAGSERMIINSSGNVGIGTTGPTFKLHVNSTDASDNVAYIHHNNAAQSSGDVLKVRSDAGDNAGSALLNVANNTGSALYVRGDRNVGIGTASPAQDLTLYRSSGDTNFLISSNNGASQIFFGDTESDNIGKIDYDHSDNSLNFAVNAAERMRITSSGNVGIGTTSPQTNLEVTSATGAKLRLGTSDTVVLDGDTIGRLEFFSADANNTNSGLGAFIDLVADGDQGNFNPNADLRFATSYASAQPATTRMTIKGNGNVGIGTTSPVEKLEVLGYIKSSVGFKANTYTSLLESSNDTVISNSAYYNMLFKTNNAERMRITNAGYVGIGTTSPDTFLNLEGVKNRSIITLGSTTNDSGWAVGDKIGGIDFYSADGSGAGSGVKGSISYIASTAGSGGVTAMIFSAASSVSNNLERMRIDTSGNVGIGTTTPSEKLEVNGNVQAETLIATDLTDGYVPYSKSGTLGLQDSKIYTQGAGIGVGTTTLAAGCHITSLSNISATGYRVSAMQTAPSSRGDTGTLGEIRITADYIYVCYATDSWRRVAIANW